MYSCNTWIYNQTNSETRQDTFSERQTYAAMCLVYSFPWFFRNELDPETTRKADKFCSLLADMMRTCEHKRLRENKKPNMSRAPRQGSVSSSRAQLVHLADVVCDV